MSKVYGGLVSSPYNKLDTIGHFSVTHTFDGKTIDGGVEEPATIILTTFPESIGAVSGDGIFFKGSSVTVVATPDSESEYPEFDGWYEGETKVSENASYTFTVSGARTLVAKFKEATRELVAEVFTDAACTTRPVAGGVYETLYVRLNRSYDFGDWKYYGGDSGTFEQMLVNTPNSEAPDDAYYISLWVDLVSEDYDSPFQTGSVIPVSLDNPVWNGELESPFTIDFYDSAATKGLSLARSLRQSRQALRANINAAQEEPDKLSNIDQEQDISEIDQ